MKHPGSDRIRGGLEGASGGHFVQPPHPGLVPQPHIQMPFEHLQGSPHNPSGQPAPVAKLEKAEIKERRKKLLQKNSSSKESLSYGRNNIYLQNFRAKLLLKKIIKKPHGSNHQNYLELSYHVQFPMKTAVEDFWSWLHPCSGSTYHRHPVT